MAKVRVPLHGKPQGYAHVETEATKGATLGRDLYRQDGSVVNESDLTPAAAPSGGLAVTLWRLVREIPANIVGLAAVATNGWFRKDGSTIVAREIAGADLPDLADSGTGTFKLLTRDAKGRLSGTEDGTTDDVPEGATNLYFPEAPSDGNEYVRKDAAWAVATGGGGSNPWTSIIKPGDTPRASTTTFTDDPDFTWALTSGVTYVLRGVLFVLVGNQTAGFKYQFNFTSGTTVLQSYKNNYSISGGTVSTDNDFSLAGLFMPTGSFTGGTVAGLRFAIDILIQPSADGTLSLQWAQVNSNAAPTILREKSWIDIA